MTQATWPEQNAIDAWLEKHGIEVSFQAAMELKEAVTTPRREVQHELDQFKQAERAWETTMMELVGEDGVGSAREAIQKLKDEHEEAHQAAGRMHDDYEKAMHRASQLENQKTEMLSAIQRMRVDFAEICKACGVEYPKRSPVSAVKDLADEVERLRGGSEPFAILCTEIDGGGDWFKYNPLKPGSKRHAHREQSSLWETMPVYKHPPAPVPDHALNLVESICAEVTSRSWRLGDRSSNDLVLQWASDLRAMLTAAPAPLPEPETLTVTDIDNTGNCETVYLYLSNGMKAEFDPARLMGAGMPSAWQDVFHERQRQIEKEGWTPDHDDQYREAELLRAAATYTMHAALMETGDHDPEQVPVSWPWDASWWKPTDDPRRALEKAGALILAELDRADRVASKQKGDQ